MSCLKWWYESEFWIWSSCDRSPKLLKKLWYLNAPTSWWNGLSSPHTHFQISSPPKKSGDGHSSHQQASALKCPKKNNRASASTIQLGFQAQIFVGWLASTTSGAAGWCGSSESVGQLLTCMKQERNPFRLLFFISKTHVDSTRSCL